MLASLGASVASAEIYKCTGPRGQITYSESPCPGEASVRLDLKEPVDNPTPRSAGVAPGAGSRPDVAVTTPPVPRSNGYELSYSERQRIANLEQIERTASAYREQRQSASLEIAYIRRGVVARMSQDDLRTKEHYWSDLGSIEPERRRVAAAQLANLFATYP